MSQKKLEYLESRMACLGFGLFGWVYLSTTFWLWPGPHGVSAPPFLTKALLDAVQPPSKTPTAMTIDRGPVGEMSTMPPPNVATTMRASVSTVQYHLASKKACQIADLPRS